MFNVVIDYPDVEEERRILRETTMGGEGAVRKITTGAELERLRALVRELPAASNVIDYALRLTRATRPDDPTSPPVVRKWVKWGAGPRAGQSLVLGAKATALAGGRPVPSLDDVRAVALPVFRHRVLLNFQAEADGITPDEVVRQLLDGVLG
jgi:MoxR-like ATPase